MWQPQKKYISIITYYHYMIYHPRIVANCRINPFIIPISNDVFGIVFLEIIIQFSWYIYCSEKNMRNVSSCTSCRNSIRNLLANHFCTSLRFFYIRHHQHMLIRNAYIFNTMTTRNSDDYRGFPLLNGNELRLRSYKIV